MSGELEDYKDKLQASEKAHAAAQAQSCNLSAAREDEQPLSDGDDLAAVVQVLQADLKVQALMALVPHS